VVTGVERHEPVTNGPEKHIARSALRQVVQPARQFS
jgi:hypothetical protein